MKPPAKPPIHLGQSELELALFELQHGVVCYTQAFFRYLENQLVRIAGDPNLTAQDCFILHAVRVGDRPKSIPEIQHFTNRSDIANIQYSVRKLAKAGLVERARKAGGRGVAYQVSRRGREVTDEYARERRNVIAMIPHLPAELVGELQAATRLIRLLTGVYDTASRAETAR